MNTEINFLEKEPNKYSAFLWVGITFLLLLLIAVGLLIYQKNIISSDIEALENRQAEIEVALTDIQKDFSGKRELQQLQQELETLQNETFPTVPLYRNILGLFGAEKLISYDFAGGDELVIQADFATLDDVADYITSLLEQDYITNTQLTSVSQMEETYQAVLTISFNRDNIMEELDTDG